jgi:hypothetical protein
MIMASSEAWRILSILKPLKEGASIPISEKTNLLGSWTLLEEVVRGNPPLNGTPRLSSEAIDTLVARKSRFVAPAF